MVGDSKIRGPRTEVGGHVGALPDGSMTSYDAPGRVGLHGPPLMTSLARLTLRAPPGGRRRQWLSSGSGLTTRRLRSLEGARWCEP